MYEPNPSKRGGHETETTSMKKSRSHEAFSTSDIRPPFQLLRWILDQSYPTIKADEAKAEFAHDFGHLFAAYANYAGVQSGPKHAQLSDVLTQNAPVVQDALAAYPSSRNLEPFVNLLCMYKCAFIGHPFKSID